MHIWNLSSKAQIVNISFAAPRCSLKVALGLQGLCVNDILFDGFTPLFDLMSLAFLYAHDTLFVVAAGNDGIDVAPSLVGPIRIPAVIPAGISLPNVLVVAAATLSDQKKSNSNWGGRIDLAAPGEQIWTPKPGGNYDTFGDTSGAAPMVTGVAGLLKALKPALTPTDIKQILIDTADPIHTGDSSKRIGTGCYSNPNDQVNTGCLLNAFKAVRRVLPITVDGNPSDWAGISPLLTDAAGDGPFNTNGNYFAGQDFVNISVTNDSTNVYFLFEFAGNHSGGIVLRLDTDLNTATGCNGSEYLIFVTVSEPGGHLALSDFRDCAFSNDFPGKVLSAPGHGVSKFLEAAISIETLRTLTPGMTGFRISGTATSPPPSGVSDQIGPGTYLLH